MWVDVERALTLEAFQDWCTARAACDTLLEQDNLPRRVRRALGDHREFWVDPATVITSEQLQDWCLARAEYDALETVPPGSLLYVRYLRAMPLYAARLVGPCRVISNYHDYPVDEALLDTVLGTGKVTQLFSVNAVCTHPALAPIPLGFRRIDRRFLRGSGEARDILCYANFKTRHRPSQRVHVWEWATAQPWVTARPWDKRQADGYFADLRRSRFVLSPPGGGLDCYRTWEALAAGAIPIVLRNALAPLYDGLPVLQVERFEDLTPEHLEAFVPETWGLERLTAAYWGDRVGATRLE